MSPLMILHGKNTFAATYIFKWQLPECERRKLCTVIVSLATYKFPSHRVGLMGSFMVMHEYNL